MKTIAASDFLGLIQSGTCEFQYTIVEGDVDLGDMYTEKLVLDHVQFTSEVKGHITISYFIIRSPMCSYFSNIRPLCYCGHLIKDMTS